MSVSDLQLTRVPALFNGLTAISDRLVGIYYAVMYNHNDIHRDYEFPKPDKESVLAGRAFDAQGGALCNTKKRNRTAQIPFVETFKVCASRRGGDRAASAALSLRRGVGQDSRP